MQGWSSRSLPKPTRRAHQGPREKLRSHSFRDWLPLGSNASLPAGTGGLSTPRVSHYVNGYALGHKSLKYLGIFGENGKADRYPLPHAWKVFQVKAKIKKRYPFT